MMRTSLAFLFPLAGVFSSIAACGSVSHLVGTDDAGDECVSRAGLVCNSADVPAGCTVGAATCSGGEIHCGTVTCAPVDAGACAADTVCHGPSVPAGCTVGASTCDNGTLTCGAVVCPEGDAGTPPGDAGSDATPGDAAAAKLTLLAYGGPPGHVAAEVTFPEPGVGQVQTCGNPTVSGACTLTSCVLGGIGSPGGGIGNYGTVTASVGATTETLAYNIDGYPTTYFPSSLSLGEGAIMTFRGGNGGSVPTFDLPVTIPGVATLTAPTPAASTIDTSQELTVTWKPISIGQINFQLSGSTSSGGVGQTQTTIQCLFPGDSGSGVVSQALLASLKQANDSAVYAGVGSQLTVTKVIDGFTITTQSSQYLTPAEGNFEVTLR
jgi:hypothetical protein